MIRALVVKMTAVIYVAIGLYHEKEKSKKISWVRNDRKSLGGINQGDIQACLNGNFVW